MNWVGWEAFWAIGGYAPYVWGSYGVTLLAIAAEIWALAARRREVLQRLRGEAR